MKETDARILAEVKRTTDNQPSTNLAQRGLYRNRIVSGTALDETT